MRQDFGFGFFRILFDLLSYFTGQLELVCVCFGLSSAASLPINQAQSLLLAFS
jgi:hypothetical protein